jgi:hypothetical protein
VNDPPDIATERAKHLLESRVHSLDQLLVLLHLHKERRSSQRLDSIAQAVQMDEELAMTALRSLIDCELVRSDGEGVSLVYRYDPASTELDGAVEDLAHFYARSRFSVISLIAADAVGRVRESTRRTFAQLMQAGRGPQT